MFEDCEGEYRCVGVTEDLEFIGPSIGEEVSEEELDYFRDDDCKEGAVISVRKSFGRSEKVLRIGGDNIRFSVGGNFRRRFIEHYPKKIGIHTKAIHSKQNNIYF